MVKESDEVEGRAGPVRMPGGRDDAEGEGVDHREARRARVEKALSSGWRVIQGERSMHGKRGLDVGRRSGVKQAERLQRLRERYQRGALEYDADAVARRLLMRLLGATE